MASLDEEGRAIRARADFDARMNAARRRAGYELGDPSWASVIIGAFLYPESDTADWPIAQVHV